DGHVTGVQTCALPICGGLYLMGETSLERILEQVDELKPTALVVDSVQTVYSSKFNSAPGSISQVREVATQLLFLAKGRGVTIFRSEERRVGKERECRA